MPRNKFFSRFLLLTWLLCLCGGCAMGARENRRLTTVLSDHLTPDAAWGRWSLLPLAIPVGGVSLVTDTFVVHPACSLPNAWLDTAATLWGFDLCDRYYSNAMTIPIRATLTPILFVSDWLVRSGWDVDPPDGDPLLLDPDPAAALFKLSAKAAARADAPDREAAQQSVRLMAQLYSEGRNVYDFRKNFAKASSEAVLNELERSGKINARDTDDLRRTFSLIEMVAQRADPTMAGQMEALQSGGSSAAVRIAARYALKTIKTHDLNAPKKVRRVEEKSSVDPEKSPALQEVKP